MALSNCLILKGRKIQHDEGISIQNEDPPRINSFVPKRVYTRNLTLRDVNASFEEDNFRVLHAIIDMI